VVKDVYFLTVHDPYEEPDAPGPVNGLIVHARTLLHLDLPQPDAGRIYRCLTEFPGRTPGCLVPLSTLHYELDDGRLWPEVADWKTAVRALIALTRMPELCESMPLVLPPVQATLLATGPFAPVPPGLGIPERSQLLDMLASSLPEAAGTPLLWPGDNLLPPPEHPAALPYQPHGT
jgi:hypothetical protein